MSHYSRPRARGENVRGKEIVEITPVILGGDPEDSENKAVLTREEHFEMVRYWNKAIRDMKAERDAKRE
jgi:hypothetical protein